MVGHGETPQLINYGTSGQSKIQAISGIGEDYNYLTRENQEYPTIHPYFVSNISYLTLDFCSEYKFYQINILFLYLDYVGR